MFFVGLNFDMTLKKSAQFETSHMTKKFAHLRAASSCHEMAEMFFSVSAG